MRAFFVRKTMSLKKIIERLSAVTGVPIEISEIRDQIISLGIQDEIIFSEDEKMDPVVLRGIYYQYTRHNDVYGDPILCSIIVYSSALSVEWQRAICCKEMIHIFDSRSEKTVDLDELDGLLKRVLGPLSTDEFNIFDIMAAKDRLALYQSIPLLFPEKARVAAISQIARGIKTPEEIARQLCIPIELVNLALLDEWPELIRHLCD